MEGRADGGGQCRAYEYDFHVGYWRCGHPDPGGDAAVFYGLESPAITSLHMVSQPDRRGGEHDIAAHCDGRIGKVQNIEFAANGPVGFCLPPFRHCWLERAPCPPKSTTQQRGQQPWAKRPPDRTVIGNLPHPTGKITGNIGDLALALFKHEILAHGLCAEFRNQPSAL